MDGWVDALSLSETWRLAGACRGVHSGGEEEEVGSGVKKTPAPRVSWGSAAKDALEMSWVKCRHLILFRSPECDAHLNQSVPYDIDSVILRGGLLIH